MFEKRSLWALLVVPGGCEMSDRDCVGHPDFDPKGTRNNLHSQHKGAGRLQAQSATGRDSKNSQQQENLRDCRTQVISPRPLLPAKLSMKAKKKGTESDRETKRKRARERGRERNNKKVPSWRRRDSAKPQPCWRSFK